MQENPQASMGRTFVEIILLAAVYVATARLGQLLAIPPGNVTPVWLPSGIVLAVVLLRGSVIWPGIWLGAFIGNVWAYIDWENFSNLGVSFISGTANGVGDTLAALISAYMIQRYTGTHRPFGTTLQVAQFVLFGAVIGGAVSAVFGVTGLAVVGLLSWTEYTYVWVTWWVGDGVGVILITPLLLTLNDWFNKHWLREIDWRELLAFAAVLALVCSLTLGLIADAHLPLPLFMVLPVLLWGALRFPGHVVILGAVLMSGAAVTVTSQGAGPFQSEELNRSLIELQLFLCTALVTLLLLLGTISERRRLEASLAKLSQNYMRMFDRAIGGVIITDNQGCIESFNQTAETIFGYTQQELLGRNVNFLVPHRLRERHYEYIDNPDEHRLSRIFGRGREVVGYHRDGHEIPLLISINPSFDEEPRRYLVVLQDLSQHKQMEADCRLYQQTFDLLVQSAFDAMLVVNNNLVVNVNERFQKLFAYTPEELLNKPLKLKLFTTDLVFIEGQGQVVASEGIDKHGRRFPVEVQQKSDKVGDNSVKIISIRDLTQIKGQQNELKLAVERARNANVAKSRFLSSMSHELRTPMNAIVGFAQLLDMGEGQLTERQRESVKEIRTAGNHLLEVIDDILDLARIEAGTFVVNCEDVNMNSLMADCVELTKGQAGKRGIKVFNHLGEQQTFIVNADPFRLKQVVLNLLSNAVKFNHADGTVSVSAEPTTGDRLRISVTDSGVGLTDSEQERLFQPFERASADNSSVKGTGIGLVISKSLVELMGGAIGLESYKYMGSTFWIELPLNRVITGRKPEPNTTHSLLATRPDAEAVTQKKILYVEDQPANIKLLEHLIEKLAIGRFYSAVNGPLGLEIAREENPDLIVLDINMPGMDGFALLKMIKEDAALAQTPVIALSSSTTEEDIKRGMDAGFDDYITKPVDLDKLSQVLIKLLS